VFILYYNLFQGLPSVFFLYNFLSEILYIIRDLLILLNFMNCTNYEFLIFRVWDKFIAHDTLGSL
jgi:hypothetical protein